MNSRTLIIGSKTFDYLRTNKLLDSFKHNIRCNMGIPHGNNGSIKDRLAVCVHINEFFIKKQSDWETILSVYGEEYKIEFLKHFYDTFSTKDYNNVYYAHPNRSNYNKLLSKWGCPHSFSTQPRCGYVVIFEELLMRDKHRELPLPLVFGFSINSETRKTFYVKDFVFKKDDDGTSQHHNKNDEIKIIRWLHKNNKIDITPCMLQDCEVPTLNCEGMEPSQEVIDLLKSVYQKVIINK